MNSETVQFRFLNPCEAVRNALVLKELERTMASIPSTNGLDLTMERGQRVLFVGPNGAGKSTLL